MQQMEIDWLGGMKQQQLLYQRLASGRDSTRNELIKRQTHRATTESREDETVAWSLATEASCQFLGLGWVGGSCLG